MVLASIDLAVAEGEFVSLIGPSGCGKSTLFNIIAGVQQLTSGTIAIDGDAGTERAGKSGYMPQQPLLLPWRTVEENVMLGLDVRRVPRKKASYAAYELLKRFGLAEFARHYPATLSGGMRQRVALLRTVLFNRSFLLLDEPFGALDALTRLSCQMWLLDLWHEFHSSVLFITHDVRTGASRFTPGGAIGTRVNVPLAEGAKHMKLRRLASYGPAFVLAITLLALWELCVRATQVSPLILPAPTAIIQALVNNWGVIYDNTVQTLLETVLGMGAAILLGLLLAILLDTSSWMRRAIYPWLVVSQTIPIITLALLLLLWLGYTIIPKIIVVTLYCFFPIAIACADGLASAEPDLLNLLRSMRASRWQTLWLVRLPGAMPAFFSGLRIAATYSVTGAIFGEYVGGSKGLGIYMENATNSFAIVLVFAAILVTAVLSIMLFGLVSIIERLALPWYHGAAARK